MNGAGKFFWVWFSQNPKEKSIIFIEEEYDLRDRQERKDRLERLGGHFIAYRIEGSTPLDSVRRETAEKLHTGTACPKCSILHFDPQ